MTEKKQIKTKSQPKPKAKLKAKSKSKFKGFLIKLLIVVNILSVLSICVSYLSIYINPAKFSYPAFFGLAYPYILLLNLFFIALWIVLKRRWFLLSLISIAFGYGYLNDFISFSLSANV